MVDYPHDEYIAAITGALTDVGLDPTTITRDDSDTRGTYCYLRALFALDDLLLIWEWHTGIEAAHGEPERGPVWLWAKRLSDGVNTEPAVLPVDGYANPVQVAAAAGELVDTGTAVKRRPGQWDGSKWLDAACEAWGAAETSE
jgi:hypothetical protein